MDKNILIETVTSAQNGDTKALETLYVEFVKTVYFFALKSTGNQNDAEDITQETFCAMCEKISDLEQPEAFAGWLKRIAANKCTDYFRKKGRDNIDDMVDINLTESLPEEEQLFIPEKAFDNAETAQMITDIIDTLPDPQRLCIYYYYYEQLTVAQIAELLNTNDNAVKKRLQMARGKIRKELERLDNENGVKLYSAAPLMLTPILKLAFQNFEMPAELTTNLWLNVSAKTAAVTKGVILSLKAKIAMALAGTAVVGGITTGVIMSTADDNASKIPDTSEIITTNTIVTIKNATETMVNMTEIMENITGTVTAETAISTIETVISTTEITTEQIATTSVSAETETTATDQIIETVITEITTEPPAPVILTEIGDTIKIGGYDWQVLDIQNGKALVISVQVLTLRQYHSNRKDDVTWENSDIRKWLNGDFYNSFSTNEKALIADTLIKNENNQWYDTAGGNSTTDKIFLLSLEEVVEYFGDSGQLWGDKSSSPINDMYNSARTALYNGKIQWWWTRSPGNGKNYAANINNNGFIDLGGDIADNKNGGIRPAMWVKCE